MCFAFPTTPMIGLSQERERGRGKKKVNELSRPETFPWMMMMNNKKFNYALWGAWGVYPSLSLSLQKSKKPLLLLRCAAKPNPSCLKVPKVPDLSHHTQQQQQQQHTWCDVFFFFFSPQRSYRVHLETRLFLLSYLFISTTPKSSH